MNAEIRQIKIEHKQQDEVTQTVAGNRQMDAAQDHLS